MTETTSQSDEASVASRTCVALHVPETVAEGGALGKVLHHPLRFASVISVMARSPDCDDTVVSVIVGDRRRRRAHLSQRMSA